MEFSLEQVREKVTLIGHAVEEVDTLTKNAVEARWKFEMVKRKPELGRVRHPQTGEVVRTFAAKDFADNVAHLIEERDVAIEALKALTGTDSVDSARVAYLNLVTAYQRLGSLRELNAHVAAGSQAARESAAAQDLLNGSEFEAALASAFEHLKTVDTQITVPEIEVPQIVSAGGMFRA